MEAAIGRRRAGDERRAERAARRAEGGRRGLFSLPAVVERPLVVLVVVTVLLALLGAVMVNSATFPYPDEREGAARQVLYVLVGVVAALVVVWVSSSRWMGWARWGLWAFFVLTLLLVLTPVAGLDANGASRWLGLGSFHFQPSEFAKFDLVLVASVAIGRYYEGSPATWGPAMALSGRLSARGHGSVSAEFVQLLMELAVGVGLPAVLIVVEPDSGTAVVIAATLIVLLFLAGASWGSVAALVALGALGVALLFVLFSHARTRFDVWLHPFADYPNDENRQLVNGLYALASGGVLGVGLGMGREKYGYLPMASSDYIFDVIGEELGLVGTLGVVAAFAAIGWAGYRIARYAPDLSSKLVAAGSTTMLVVQAAVNILGVTQTIPASGKALPFLTRGGSSVIASFALVGLIVSVALTCRLPETAYDERRRSLRVSEGDDRSDPGLSSAGMPTRRSERWRASGERGAAPASAAAGTARAGRAAQPTAGTARDYGYGQPRPLTLVQGGRDAARPASGAGSGSSGGYARRDLGPSAAERLRPSGGAPVARERRRRHDREP